MKCPFCEFNDTQVKDSRPTEDGAIKRRRQCPKCLARFITHERVELREIKVIKKNGEVRPLDENKITRSIEVACRKRPVNNRLVDHAVHAVLQKINQLGDSVITSNIIGELVLAELSKIDDVAYVRYASVYKDFSKAEDFGNFIAKIRS